ncbi:uncharacterized protein LOC131649231 [Vicia villosa]|uniref:uncharacterized protein LOC131649231 n=1 Tax=Vicia villosa TaxID=3911 RepID=UPI00273BDCBB|nr:uncharacterized protein LOC131649231 [Vicia villosa]
MSRPIEPLKEINDSKDLWKIAVRCKHLWTVTSSSNKEHMEMRDMIQPVVPSYLLSKFKSEIETGNSYIMQNFKVGKNDFAFKSTNYTYKLVFCGSTFVKKAEFPDIPHNYLNIIGLNSIVEGRFQSNVLVDASKTVVQCTLWGQLAVQLYEYYKNNKQASDIVIVLINARVKEAQVVTVSSISCDSGGFPVSVSNTWNGTKLLGVDLLLLSSSSVQVEATQNSFYSDYDKFVWKAEIMSLSEIENMQHETTCVTVATLDKFDAGQMEWYYDGCVECTRSVNAKDGKLKCFKEHISPEPVPQYNLDITAVEGSSKAKFVFWDTDCVKLIGKSALQMKMDLTQSVDYDPLEFPYELDSILKKELAIRAVYQPKNGRLSVIGFKTDEDVRNKIKESFKFEEEPISTSAENDLTIENSGFTPCKRLINDAVEDNDSVQQSSTKMAKDIKQEKYFKGDFPKFSVSSVQVTASQNSYYSDYDKFGLKADIFGAEEPSSPDDVPSVSEPLSVSVDYEPSVSNTNLTPSKEILSDVVEDIEVVQLSSTKLIKDIKKDE